MVGETPGKPDVKDAVKSTVADLTTASRDGDPHKAGDVLRDHFRQLAQAGYTNSDFQAFTQGLRDGLKGSSILQQMPDIWAQKPEQFAKLSAGNDQIGSRQLDLAAGQAKDGIQTAEMFAAQDRNPATANYLGDREFDSFMVGQLQERIKSSDFSHPKGWGGTDQYMTQQDLDQRVKTITDQHVTANFAAPLTGPDGQKLFNYLQTHATDLANPAISQTSLQQYLTDAQAAGSTDGVFSQKNQDFVKTMLANWDKPAQGADPAIHDAIMNLRGTSSSSDYSLTMPNNWIDGDGLKRATGLTDDEIKNGIQPAKGDKPAEPAPPAQGTDAAKLTADAKALGAGLSAPGFPQKDLGINNPGDPISLDAVNKSLTRLNGMDPAKTSAADKAAAEKEIAALEQIRTHWKDIAGDKPTAGVDQLSKWINDHGGTFNGFAKPAEPAAATNPADLTAEQKAALDNANPTYQPTQDSIKPGQNLFEFMKGHTHPGASNADVRQRFEEIAKANGLVTPENQKYWDLYKKDGDWHHLPKSVAGVKDWKIPPEDPQQQMKQAAEGVIGPVKPQFTEAQAKQVNDLFQRYYQHWPYGGQPPATPEARAMALESTIPGGLAKLRGFEGVEAAIQAAQKLHEQQMEAAMNYMRINAHGAT